MGYTIGSGKPVFGYYDAVPFYGEFEEAEGSVTYQQRVFNAGLSESVDASFDVNGHEIGRWGFSDNLMVIGALTVAGYPQRSTVYESCLDAAAWISENCLEPGDCLAIDPKA